MNTRTRLMHNGWLWMLLGTLLTLAAYWPGLHGGYIFDDYPNIVDNTALQIDELTTSKLAQAALSSPSSDLKRPLASISFALNHVATGLDPFAMKLTNLLLHLLNGLLFFVLGRALLLRAASGAEATRRAAPLAAVLACGWMLLPINLSSVLYVVQRMESLAQLFVLLGLLGYLAGRNRMSTAPRQGLLICALSLIVMTALGLMAKETAVLLPLYAAVMEWLVLGGLRRHAPNRRALLLLYGVILVVPLIIGLSWILPSVLNPHTWLRRDFTLGERLLTEGRVVLGYVGWTLLPLPQWLSFYHDDYLLSRGWLSPATTLPSLLALGALAAAALALRRRNPLFALGVAWYFCAHLLTGTVLRLELVFEHRNYFASYGVLLAVFALLFQLSAPAPQASTERPRDPTAAFLVASVLVLMWAGFTSMSARIWSDPLRLALELEARAPNSARARYDLGRVYLVYSGYHANSPFTSMAYRAFGDAAELDQSSILPEQAMIYMASRMQQPVKPEWWQQMQRKLTAKPPSIEDDGSLMALVRCSRDGHCAIDPEPMVQTLLIALDHPKPSANLLAAYGDYAWNVLKDPELALRVAHDAVARKPSEPTHRVTLIRMLLATGQLEAAEQQMKVLESMSRAGSLEATLRELREIAATFRDSVPKADE